MEQQQQQEGKLPQSGEALLSQQNNKSEDGMNETTNDDHRTKLRMTPSSAGDDTNESTNVASDAAAADVPVGGGGKHDDTNNNNNDVINDDDNTVKLEPVPTNRNNNCSNDDTMVIEPDEVVVAASSNNLVPVEVKDEEQKPHQKQRKQARRRRVYTNTNTRRNQTPTRSQTPTSRSQTPTSRSTTTAATFTTTRRRTSVMKRETSSHSGNNDTGNDTDDTKRVPNPKRTKRKSGPKRTSRSMQASATTINESSSMVKPQRHDTDTDDDNDDDAAVPVVAAAAAASNKRGKDRDDQYRITNPLILDYNDDELLYAPPNNNQQVPQAQAQQQHQILPLLPPPIQKQKPLSLVQIQQISNGISFAIPDTYSLRYMIQLLGLPQQHIVQKLDLWMKHRNINNNGGVQPVTTSAASSSNEQQQQLLLLSLLLDRPNRPRTNMVAVPDNRNAYGNDRSSSSGNGSDDVTTDDTIYHLPAIGVPPYAYSNTSNNSKTFHSSNFWTINTKEEIDLLMSSAYVQQRQASSLVRNTTSTDQNLQQQQQPLSSSSSSSLLLDPFYIQLWQSISSSSSSFGPNDHPRTTWIVERIPITSVQHAKIFRIGTGVSSSLSSSTAAGIGGVNNTSCAASSSTGSTAVPSATTTISLKNHMNDSDSKAAEKAPLSHPDPVHETILETSSTRSNSPDVLLQISSNSPPLNNVVDDERYIISAQQQQVLQYVLNIAVPVLASPSPPIASTTIASTTTTSTALNSVLELPQQQRYKFIPYEQAIEMYPNIISNILATMKNGNGIRTGWVAIDTTTKAPPVLPGALYGKKNELTSRETSVSLGAVVGLVLYQLEWCAFGKSIETSSEMIVHVLGMYVDGTPTVDANNGTNNIDKNLESQLHGGRRLFDSVAGQPTDTTPSETITWLRLVLLSLVLEHARQYNVWYAIVTSTIVSEGLVGSCLYKTYFQMVPAQCDHQTMICDLHNTSVRYAFLQYQEQQLSHNVANIEQSFHERLRHKIERSSSGKQRWLVRLPFANEVRTCLQLPTDREHIENDNHERPNDMTQVKSAPSSPHSTQNNSGKSALLFSNPNKSKRGVRVALSASFGENKVNEMTIYQMNVGDTNLGSEVLIPSYYKEPASLHVMRNFPLLPTTLVLPKQHDCAKEAINNSDSFPILAQLISKQQELKKIESDLEPTLYKLLSEVVSDRLTYESPDRVVRQNEECRILKESAQLRDRRVEQDLAWQKQLEQDMDAVCEVCLDGEVTPDNQILFCELCNVAVHQMCYGIDRVPEGDYYCIPCRRRESDSKFQAGGIQHNYVPKPVCELCPLRQGAFVRTENPPNDTDATDRFVHVLCAKWQGLNHVGDNKELVEDVTNIRRDFRRHHVKCELCQGERGGMNKCMASPLCKKWFHVTCARAVGTMNVVHGENCHGDVEETAWNLFCPEHSEIAADDIPEGAVSIETLIRAASEFPPEEIPPPLNSLFSNLTGPERRLLLADFSYEKALIKEVLRCKYNGLRCEICDLFDDESKSWTRCVSCNVIFCRFCKLDVDEVKGSYKCVSCKFVEQKTKAKEVYEDPKCCTCVQVGGLLRGSYANPIGGKFKKRPEYAESLFAKQTWVHSLCAIWLPDLELPRDIGTVNLSGVVCVTHKGKSMINHRRRCFLCGHRDGLKMQCDVENCFCNINGENEKLVMHATCARQAGLEVRVDDKRVNNKGGPLAYVKCYRHSGNEFNLRAKLEDMLEIEKRRAGNDFSKSDAPMKLSEASKLLYSAIEIMRILGWAWRWAEWWVDYNSSWEPLLEPGQKEKNMTKEELKIVDSTRESRCADARKCRLAAFGAAVRNRMYDAQDGFKRTALDKALRAILNTTSLVGPLTPVEIEFYIEWLGRAYRSKSRVLYLGEHKCSISSEASVCIHDDGTPKYQLENRPLPGELDLPIDEIFEIECNEIDSFLRDELLTDVNASIVKLSRKQCAKRKSKPGESISKKSPAVHSFAIPLVTVKARGKPNSKSVDSEDESDTTYLEYVPPPKRRRSAPDCATTGTFPLQEIPDIKISPVGKGKAERPPRSSYAEQNPESLVYVAGISSVEDSEVSINLIGSSIIDGKCSSVEYPKLGHVGTPTELLVDESIAEEDCIDAPTAPESTINLCQLSNYERCDIEVDKLVLTEPIFPKKTSDKTPTSPGAIPNATDKLSLITEQAEEESVDAFNSPSKSRSRSIQQRSATEICESVSTPHAIPNPNPSDTLSIPTELTEETSSVTLKIPAKSRSRSTQQQRAAKSANYNSIASSDAIPNASDNMSAKTELSEEASRGTLKIPVNLRSRSKEQRHVAESAPSVIPIASDKQSLKNESMVEETSDSLKIVAKPRSRSIQQRHVTDTSNSIPNAMDNIFVTNQPFEQAGSDTLQTSSKSRSSSIRQRNSAEVTMASSSNYESVKKRNREPTRPFTYERHEISGSIRKHKMTMGGSSMATEVPTKKYRSRSNRKSSPVEATSVEIAVTIVETNVATLSEPSIEDEKKDNKTPNLDSNISISMKLTAADSVTESGANDATATTTDSTNVNVDVKNETVDATAATNQQDVDKSSPNTKSETATTRYTKIRRPGRPRGNKDKARR